MTSGSTGKYTDLGLLVLRVGIGAMSVCYGVPQLFGGPAKWKVLGRALSVFGITYAPEFWGFLAAFSMVAGGVCLIVGFLFKTACVVLFLTAAGALSVQWRCERPFAEWARNFQLAVVFLSLLLIGPGDLNLVARIGRRKGG